MKTSAAVPFSFESHEVRAMTIEGDPWFVAKDVCSVLEIEWKGSSSLSFLDEDEKGVRNLRTPGGDQEMIIISESGLYTLIIRSNKPQAKPFRKWVTAEVLPSIRRTGGYKLPGKDSRVDFFHHRGPVSDSGLDIRYTLDLTKIILRPTRVSLELLQRLTGVEVSDLAAAAVVVRPGTETDDTLARFVREMAFPLHGSKIELRKVYKAYSRWCDDCGIDKKHIASTRSVASYLREIGYDLKKHGNIVVYGMALQEVGA